MMKRRMPGAPVSNRLRVPIKQDPDKVAASILNEMGMTKLHPPEGAPRGLEDIPLALRKPSKPPGAKRIEAD